MILHTSTAPGFFLSSTEVTYDAFLIPVELAWDISARDYYLTNLVFIAALLYWVCDIGVPPETRAAAPVFRRAACLKLTYERLV